MRASTDSAALLRLIEPEVAWAAPLPFSGSSPAISRSAGPQAPVTEIKGSPKKRVWHAELGKRRAVFRRRRRPPPLSCGMLMRLSGEGRCSTLGAAAGDACHLFKHCLRLAGANSERPGGANVTMRCSHAHVTLALLPSRLLRRYFLTASALGSFNHYKKDNSLKLKQVRKQEL